MPSRRFTLLGGVLVALNLALWLAPPGLGAHKVVVAQLLGSRLVRAEVIDSTGGSATIDWRIDRGVITKASATQLTLREADGRVQAIPLSSSTKVNGAAKLRSLKHGWHVLVTWQADGAASTVQVEGRGSSSHAGIAPLFASKLVRAEVIDSSGGSSTLDWRLDRGVVTSASTSQLTLQEADGRAQTIQLSSATKVTSSGKLLSLSSLSHGWRVLVTWQANSAADSVQVEARGSAGGGGGGGGGKGHVRIG